MSYGRIEIPKDMRNLMRLKTGDKVIVHLEDNRITLMNLALELERE